MSLKSWFFGTDDDEPEVKIEEKPQTIIDPVIEKQRQEKFSKPMIFDDFDEDTDVKPVKKEVRKEPKKEKTVEKKKEAYRMSTVISPIFGVDETKEEEKSKKTTTKKKVTKKRNDDIVQVISPFYGFEEDKEEDVQPVVIAEEVETVEEEIDEKPIEEEVVEEPVESKKIEMDDVSGDGEVIDSVENRLRNIASLTEESQDDLKIIEERTGKFKLDFKKGESLIDEIDDNMSLDELMNLYEKKFKD